MQALFIAELITKTKQNYYNNSVSNAHHSYPSKWFKFSVCALSGCCSTIGGSSILNQYLWLMNYSKHSLINGKTVSQAANIIVIGSESL